MGDSELVETLRREVLAAKSHAAWARGHGMTPQFLSAVLCGRRPPSEAIGKALGLRPAPRDWVPTEEGDRQG